MVGLRAGEQIGQIKNLIVLAECLQYGVAGHTEVDGSGLCQLHHVRLGPQKLAGVHLHHVLVPQLFIDKILKRRECEVGRMVGGLVVADPDGSLFLGAPAAA